MCAKCQRQDQSSGSTQYFVKNDVNEDISMKCNHILVFQGLCKRLSFYIEVSCWELYLFVSECIISSIYSYIWFHIWHWFCYESPRIYNIEIESIRQITWRRPASHGHNSWFCCSWIWRVQDVVSLYWFLVICCYWFC